MVSQQQVADPPPPGGRATALVTGVDSPLGRVIAHSVARKGIPVAAQGYSRNHVLEVAEAITASGGTAVPVVADLTVERDVERALDRVEDQLGPVRFLVNNAWLPGPETASSPFLDIQPADWRRYAQDNLLILHMITQRVTRTLERTGRQGGVVTVLRGTAESETSLAQYFLRAVVGAFTAGVGTELLRSNIRLNAVRARADTDLQLVSATALDLLSSNDTRRVIDLDPTPHVPTETIRLHHPRERHSL